MGSIYSGWGVSRNQVGECENGSIYKGWGIGREQIGEYDNGAIYKGWGMGREQIGEYDNGAIYKGWGMGREQIGEYDNSGIYKGWGLGREQVGEYDGSPACAAAFLLFYGVGSSSSNHTSSNNYTASSNYTASNFGGSSDSGFFDVIIALVVGLFWLFVKVLRFFFIYIWLPAVVGASLIGWIGSFLMVISAALGLIPVAFVFGIICSLIAFTFYPYYIILIVKKIKHRWSWKKILPFYGKWFLKGPLAYKELMSINDQSSF